jgi:cell division protein FtsL
MSYNKLLSQFNQLQSQNDFNLREIEDCRKQISEQENEKMDLRAEIQDLT